MNPETCQTLRCNILKVLSDEKSVIFILNALSDEKRVKLIYCCKTVVFAIAGVFQILFGLV